MFFVLQSSLLIAAVLAAGCADVFSEPGTPLSDAAHRGDIAAMQRIVAQGADVNAFGPDGRTALHWAASGGHPIGPHRCSEAANWPLVVAALLDLGANPDLADRRRVFPFGSTGWTPLYTALRHEQFNSATLMLERGADPNVLNRRGGSVLGAAADEGAPLGLLQLILARGFDPQIARSRRAP